MLGFITYWDFGRFTYIEHLAVDKQHRHKGIGSRLIQCATTLGRPLLLEVEPPVDDTTRKRVEFYQQLGLVLQTGVDYVQPPYAPGLPEVPLCLMTSADMAVEDIQKAVDILRKEVYHAE